MNVALGLLVDWEEGRRGGGEEGRRGGGEEERKEEDGRGSHYSQLVEHYSRQCPSTCICSYNFLAKAKDSNSFPTALKHRPLTRLASCQGWHFGMR